MTIAFFAALLFLIACTVADVRNTRRGIVANLAVEGNSWIVAMFGPKPTALQLYTANTLFSLPMIACGALGINFNLYQLIALSLGSMISYGALHIKGAYDWAKLGA